MTQSRLAKISPLNQCMISHLLNNTYIAKISDRKKRQFLAWYSSYQTGNVPEGSTRSENQIRLTFHPYYEVPLLRKWYDECKYPSQGQLTEYLHILNSSHVRKERPKLSLSSLKNWWTNKRQQESRSRKRSSAVLEDNPTSENENTGTQYEIWP